MNSLNSIKTGFSLLCLMFVFSAHTQNILDTRLMHDPAISENLIAFIYAEDLWIAEPDGTNPRRITVDEGVESNPVFSPDGSLIAFNAEYDGNVDVFVVASSGGIPKRLTWHPYNDQVAGFTPDGQGIMFVSQRNSYTRRFAQLYTVAVNGGQVNQLPIPTAFHAAYSPDGKYIAYTPLADRFTQWKNYRGGTQSRIWIYDVNDHEVIEIPKPEGGSNDTQPQWIDNSVFFLSDREGEFNLYAFDIDSKMVTQLTTFEDFPILNLNTNGYNIIFEHAGYLHTYSTIDQNLKKLTIGIAADLLELRPRFVSGNQYIRSASISPSGARTAFDFRGDIITVPEKKGDSENLTLSQGAHEKFPGWSPDGASIAYFSDQSGEYMLHIKNLETNAIQVFNPNGTGFYGRPHWSPDNKKISFIDNGRNLYVLDIATKQVNKIGTDELYFPGQLREMFGSWSPDSRWIAYTKITPTNFEQAYLYDTKEGKSFPLSDGLSNVSEPTFDPSGKYIYMLSSTDAGPVVNWFDQSNQDMESSNQIYLVTLSKDLISPLVKENDEEKPTEEKKEEKKEEVTVVIDWQNIQNRIINLPMQTGQYYNLSVPEEGQIYYMSFQPHSGFSDVQPLMHYDLMKREGKEVMKANSFQISASGKKMLYNKGNNWGVTDVGKKPENGYLNTGAIEVKIDPVKEWKNIFEEAWRVNRDYFYDPNYHGLDWNATKLKYQPFIADISCRSDLYRVMQWMFSELGVGHHRFSSVGDRMSPPDRISGGVLGADYIINNNRYQFKKIYGGLNWTPDLRSPLTEPGINVQEGEYLIAVNGVNVTADQNIYSFFENTAGKIVSLSISSNVDGSNTRIVNVVPLSNDRALRNRDWVEGNMKHVHEATDGKVAYVYVPNTAGAGHQYFKRYFFPQADKQAIIIDERHNAGGQLADYYIDILKKPYQSSWNFRYGNDLKAPSASIQGPKVMLIDETAGSGGDYLPWLFRQNDLGTIIGKRTWGGLVGVLGYPEFIDGGSVTAPNVAFWTEEEGFGVENVGVSPDIEIEQWPKDVIAGKDPQLEKAIEVILQQLKANPPRDQNRPDYPKRVRD